jgi:hypothetical protein
MALGGRIFNKFHVPAPKRFVIPAQLSAKLQRQRFSRIRKLIEHPSYVRDKRIDNLLKQQTPFHISPRETEK